MVSVSKFLIRFIVPVRVTTNLGTCSFPREKEKVLRPRRRKLRTEVLRGFVSRRTLLIIRFNVIYIILLYFLSTFLSHLINCFLFVRILFAPFENYITQHFIQRISHHSTYILFNVRRLISNERKHHRTNKSFPVISP